MKAKLITHFRTVSPEGDLIQMVVWQVPQPVPPSAHRYKYRLVFVREGERVIGYDNERGKGDHRHVGGVELSYTFVDPERLVEDFIAEVEAWKRAH